MTSTTNTEAAQVLRAILGAEAVKLAPTVAAYLEGAAAALELAPAPVVTAPRSGWPTVFLWA